MFLEEISSDEYSVKSPRFSPDGKTLVWLQRKAGGPHAACLRLLRADVPLSKNVGIVFSVIICSLFVGFLLFLVRC